MPPKKKRIRQRGGCASSCSCKQKGAGFVNDLINKLPVELHLRGFSGAYNFAGPGTKLDKRLDKNKIPLTHSKPINRLDETAYRHDLCYDANPSGSYRNKVCDRDMLNDINNILKDKKTGWREKADTYLVKGIIGAKYQLGLGRARLARDNSKKKKAPKKRKIKRRKHLKK